MINATKISPEEGYQLYEAGANLVIGADLGQIDSRCGGQCIHDLIQTWHDQLPEIAWPVFAVSLVKLRHIIIYLIFVYNVSKWFDFNSSHICASESGEH